MREPARQPGGRPAPPPGRRERPSRARELVPRDQFGPASSGPPRRTVLAHGSVSFCLHPKQGALRTRLRLFCARFGVAPADICPHPTNPSSATTRCTCCHESHGAFRPIHVEDIREVLASPCDWIREVRAREEATFPVGERRM